MKIPKLLILIPALTFAFSVATAASGGAVGAGALLTQGFNNWASLWGGIGDGSLKIGGQAIEGLSNIIG